MTSQFTESIAKKIANGHSLKKHGHEFDVCTSDELKDIISVIIKNPTEIKNLFNERVAYWDSYYKAIVILNPRDADGGTIFKPSRGKLYFDSLM